MKAYDLYQRFFTLTPQQQKYALGYFTGSIDTVATGFTRPHRDQAHAKWAIDELEQAINESQRER